jgi:GH24 family phage-related lysozyme (muramidase)
MERQDYNMTVLMRHVNSPRAYDLELPGRGTLQRMIYVGFVKSVVDADYMGRLQVWIPELSGDPNDSNGWFLMSYCTPFAGATNYLNNKNTQNYQDSQTSYGMWFVPPDINNEVVCAFINGDPSRGIWFGCLYQQFMNSMVPGLPGQNGTATLPTVEYNKNLTQTNIQNPQRPEFTPLASQLILAGLDNDTIRGVSDTSARRSSPPNTSFGILTPGTSQFVMDDNPSNTYIRLRTVSGCQLLINDTIGTIYMNTPNGKNWFSMDNNGRVDIYAAEDISIRAQGTLNLHADTDINIEAGNNINIKARGNKTSTPAAAATNTSPLPSTQPGPANIIGDDIGAGLVTRINGAGNGTTPGANSTQLLQALQTNTSLQTTTNAVLALGSNDDTSTTQGQMTLATNLTAIKSLVKATNLIWVLPYDTIKKGIVTTAAAGGITIDLSNYPTTDNIHPRSYDVVANDIQSKFVPPPATPSTAPVSNSAVITGGANVSTSATTTPSTPPAVVDNPAKPSGNVSVPPGTNVTGTGTATSTTQSYQTICANFLIPYEGHAKGGYGSYPDPGQPTNPALVTTGYGHVIKQNEYAQGFINCAPQPNVPVSKPQAGNFGSVCSMTQPQALALLAIDVPVYGAYVIHSLGSGAWDLLNANQQAALTSYCFNCGQGGINGLKAKGINTFITNQDVNGAASLIKNGINTAHGVPVAGLTNRRAAEAKLYAQSGSASGSSSNSATSGSASGAVGPVTVDGQTIPGTGTAIQADGGIVPTNTNLTGGFIRIESRNDFHMLSAENMFLTTVLEMHRYVGTNLYDTAAQNVNRLAGGYMAEGISGTYSISAGNNIILYSPRVDINGPAPPPPVAAAEAQGPTDYQQTDAIIDSIGNVILILSQTICTGLPFHEPYDNHGGPPLPSLKMVSALNTSLFATLRDGEVLANSSSPLNIYGTPLTGMTLGAYTGVTYNTQNQPIYTFVGDLSTIDLSVVTTWQVSPAGQQFIQSNENGSFVVESLGIPATQTIGYGHDLTATEIANNSITIGASSVSLSTALTQSQVDQLFKQDLTATMSWMVPILGNISVTQTQFDMITSLAFDIGQTNFTNSPMVAQLLLGNIQKVPNNWMQHSADSQGNPIQAYVIKRRAEATRFMTSPASALLQSGNGNVGTTNVDGTINVVPSPAN